MNGNVLMCSGVFWSTSLLWRLFITKSTLGGHFCTRDIRKWFGLTSFAASLLSSGWIITTAGSPYFLPRYLHCFRLLANFRMASRNHSLGLLRCHSWTAACAVFLPLLLLRAQFSTVLCAGAFSPQIADNRRRISDGLMPSFHRNHVVHLCSR